MYNWELAAQVQHEIVPRVSVNAGYFRRWYGNLQGHRQPDPHPGRLHARTRVTAPLDARLPGGGGYTVAGPVRRQSPGRAEQHHHLASKYGNATEVFNGVDISRERAAAAAASSCRAARASAGSKPTTVSPSTRRRAAALPPAQGATSAAGLLYCDVKPPFQPNVKLLGVYPLPWGGVQLAATFQSLPGPANHRQPDLHQRRDPAVARPQPGDRRGRHRRRAS